MKGKATKKPVEINWLKWSGKNRIELGQWVESFNQIPEEHFLYNSQEKSLKVKTLEGTSYNVPIGYYIIRGVKGEYYPCEPKIFKQTYNIKRK